MLQPQPGAAGLTGTAPSLHCCQPVPEECITQRLSLGAARLFECPTRNCKLIHLVLRQCPYEKGERIDSALPLVHLDKNICHFSQLEYFSTGVTRKLQRGALTEIVVRNSEMIALKKRKSATTMRISPFTCGLKGDGPSASFHNIRACLSLLSTRHEAWCSKHGKICI